MDPPTGEGGEAEIGNRIKRRVIRHSGRHFSRGRIVKTRERKNHLMVSVEGIVILTVRKKKKYVDDVGTRFVEKT